MNWFEETYKNGEKFVDKAADDITGDTARKYAKKREEQVLKKAAADDASMVKFKSQDLLDVDADLYTPTYNNKKMQKDQEAMLSLFNARKDQILAARATPGISQTRF